MSVLRKDLRATIDTSLAKKGGELPGDVVGYHYQVAGDGTVTVDAALLRDGSAADLADTKRGGKG